MKSAPHVIINSFSENYFLPIPLHDCPPERRAVMHLYALNEKRTGSDP